MIKLSRENVYGTSFHGTTITATTKELIELFGMPDYMGDYEEKIQNEWRFDGIDADNGVAFPVTLHDWKEYYGYSIEASICWHISGRNREETEQAREAIEYMLNELRQNK